MTTNQAMDLETTCSFEKVITKHLVHCEYRDKCQFARHYNGNSVRFCERDKHLKQKTAILEHEQRDMETYQI